MFIIHGLIDYKLTCNSLYIQTPIHTHTHTPTHIHTPTHVVMRLGHAVSPVFRFATSSGEWVWVQLEGMLRYKQGGVEPQFWEVKAKLLRQAIYICL